MGVEEASLGPPHLGMSTSPWRNSIRTNHLPKRSLGLKTQYPEDHPNTAHYGKYNFIGFPRSFLSFPRLSSIFLDFGTCGEGSYGKLTPLSFPPPFAALWRPFLGDLLTSGLLTFSSFRVSLNGLFHRSASLAIPHRKSFAAIPSVSQVPTGRSGRKTRAFVSQGLWRLTFRGPFASHDSNPYPNRAIQFGQPTSVT